jgi:hypothetical protein
LPKLTVEQLDVLADHFIRRATGNDPAAAGKMRAELEAKARAIEGIAEEVPSAVVRGA